jgi:hypothetical protein
LGASPQASSSAGAKRATRSADGGQQSAPVREPSRRTILRSIAEARRPSISCSQTAQASASNGSGRRRGRSQGRRRITGPISGSRRKRRWNSPRSWSVPSAKRIRSIAACPSSRVGASARMRTAPPAIQARTTAAPTALTRTPPCSSSTPSRPAVGSL